MLDIHVPDGAVGPTRGVQGEPGLAGPRWADESAEASPPPDLGQVPTLLGATDQPSRCARDPRPRRTHSSDVAGLPIESRVLGEHRPLHPLQGRARLDAELIEEPVPGLGVHIEGFRLTARSVERHHQQLPAVLSIGLLGNK